MDRMCDILSSSSLVVISLCTDSVEIFFPVDFGFDKKLIDFISGLSK